MVAAASVTRPASIKALIRLREWFPSEAASQRSSRSPAAVPSTVTAIRWPAPFMAERLNPSLAALKVAVIVMGVLIIVGVVVVGAEIGRRIAHPEPRTATAQGPITITVPPGCTPAEMIAIGDRLAVRLEPAAACPHLILLDRAGREVGRVEFAPSP